MDKNVWIDMESAIREQLALQVELSLDRHHAFLVKNGLPQCKDIVDVGTGNGNFLSKIALRHPAICFHGIDNKTHMVQEAEMLETSNIDWVHADALDSQTESMLKSTEGVLMRYFLLHLPNTDDSFVHLLKCMKPGNRIWVLDLDTDNCICDPPDAAFDSFVGLVQTFCDQNSVKIKTGTLLPPILEDCGFEISEIAVEQFNNREIGNQQFADYLLREASLYHYSLYGKPGLDELQSLREFLNQRMASHRHFVQYGMVMISAIKR